MRTRLRLCGDDSGWTFEEADLEGDKVLVTFRVDDGRRFGVRYDLAEVPMGNNTGWVCDTAEDWADEIGLTMDEQVLTGGVARAERMVRADGVTVLSWVW